MDLHSRGWTDGFTAISPVLITRMFLFQYEGEEGLEIAPPSAPAEEDLICGGSKGNSVDEAEVSHWFCGLRGFEMGI